MNALKHTQSNNELDWFWQSFTTPPRTTLSDWADRYRYMSLESNPTGGRWRTSTTPYLKEPLDCLTDEIHEEVVIMAPSQWGKSEVILNLVGYIIDRDPGPVLLIQETVDNARSWSSDRLTPMIRDTPCLRGKLSSGRGLKGTDEVASNQVLHKSFPGGHITMVGSNSGAGLSMRPIRYLLGDEVDAWAPSAGDEGDQISLAEKRTVWFFNHKKVFISSPRLRATSRIEPRYLASDQRSLYLPCSRCGYYQLLMWQNLKWEIQEGLPIPESVHFLCVQCKREIEEKHKHAMLRACEWRAKFPERPVAGFHSWAAHCPVVPWATLALEYVRDHKDPEKHKVFVNTRLARTWEEPGDAPAWEPLKERALIEGNPQWIVPDGVGFLTIGTDIQGDRIEYSVWGWGPGRESWLIGHDIIYGNTDSEAPFVEFEARAFIPYQQPSRNRPLTPLLAGIDTGYNAQEVYNFCRTRSTYLYPVKGASAEQAPYLSTPTWQDIDHKGQKIKKGVRLWNLGVSNMKRNFYGRLRRRKPGPRFVHFPANLDNPDEYFKQLTAEKQVTTVNDGYPRLEWKKTYANEVLDCANYALGMAIIAGLDDPRTDWESLVPGYAPALLPNQTESDEDEEDPRVTLAKPERPVVSVAPARAVTLPAPVIPRGRGVRGTGGTLARLLRG